MRIKELDFFLNNTKLFSKEFKERERQERKTEGDPDGWQQYENSLVSHYKCGGEDKFPMCLYDFTLKQVLLDH